MSSVNPLAQKLNETLLNGHPNLFSTLSQRGQQIFYPSGGIFGQAADAKGKEFNATVGIALDDDKTPMRLPSVSKHTDTNPKDAFPYAPIHGKQELRDAWKEMIKQKNPSLSGDFSTPVATTGLTHALSIAVQTFLDPDDSLILTDQFWGNYKLMFQFQHGVQFNTFNTFRDEGFDTESFREKMAEGTGKKVLLLNFPNNPSGYSLTRDEATSVVSTLQERAQAGDTVVVILDDAYFGLFFEDDCEKESLFAKLADLHENIIAVKVDGPTKEDYVWGFRVGFISIASKGASQEVLDAVADKFGGCVRASVSNVSHLAQGMLLQAYHDGSYAQEKQEKYDLMKGRYQKVRSILEDPKFADVFEPLPFNAGYFMSMNIIADIDGEELRQLLLTEYDTGVIIMNQNIRVAFSCVAEDRLEQLFENLYEAATSLVRRAEPIAVS